MESFNDETFILECKVGNNTLTRDQVVLKFKLQTKESLNSEDINILLTDYLDLITNSEDPWKYLLYKYDIPEFRMEEIKSRLVIN